MKTWKKNAVVATVLVFVCAGIYLNWTFSQKDAQPELTDTLSKEKILEQDLLVLSDGDDLVVNAAGEESDPAVQSSNYFASVRLSRQQARDGAVNLLQEAISCSGEGEENKEASTKLNEIVETTLSEAQIESLVVAKGYSDCVAYMNSDGISVAVAAPEGGLQAADVALIAEIVLAQSEYTMDQIHVVEVK